MRPSGSTWSPVSSLTRHVGTTSPWEDDRAGSAAADRKILDLLVSAPVNRPLRSCSALCVTAKYLRLHHRIQLTREQASRDLVLTHHDDAIAVGVNGGRGRRSNPQISGVTVE